MARRGCRTSLKVLLKNLLRDKDGRLVATMCGLSDLVVRCCSCRVLLGASVIRVSSPYDAVLLNA